MNKSKLIEDLKVLEVEAHDHKVELAASERKLNAAYDYEDELSVRMETAKKKTKELRLEHLTQVRSLTEVMNNNLNIYVTEFLEDNNDAGVTYKFRCPKCKEELKVAKNGWWDTDCECGHTWSLEINIIGEK